MNDFMRVIIVILISIFVFACKPSPKEMNLEDFFVIQNEILSTDLTPESKEKIVKKYGYTLKEYDELDEKVLRDPKLREKLGEIKLKKDKGEK